MPRASGASPVRSDPGYRRAWSLVIVFGVIGLLSDLVYQAGRSLNGPFLAELGANAVVGLVAGMGRRFRAIGTDPHDDRK